MKTGFDKLKARYVLGLLLIFFVFSMVSVFTLLDSSISAWGPLIDASLDLVLLAIIVLLLFKCNINIRTFIGTIPRRVKWGEIIGLLLLLSLFAVGYGILQLYLFPYMISGDQLRYEFGSPLAMIGTLLFSVIIIPIVEEFVFRGILINRWSRRWNIHVAIILSSFVFASFHLSFSTFIVGIVFSLIYVRTKTLRIPIIIHATHNFLTLIPMIYTIIIYGKEKAFEISPIPITGFYIGIVMIVITLPLLLYYIYKNWPTKKIQPPYLAEQIE